MFGVRVWPKMFEKPADTQLDKGNFFLNHKLVTKIQLVSRVGLNFLLEDEQNVAFDSLVRNYKKYETPQSCKLANLRFVDLIRTH